MPYDYKAKAKNVIIQNNYMLAKTISMFEWENLPDTIPYKELEKLLQVNGFAFITEVNGELYVIQDDNTGLENGDRVRILFKDNGDGAGDDEIVNFMRAW